MSDQHHLAFLDENLLDGPGQRIQASGKHHDLLGVAEHASAVSEIQIALKGLFHCQRNEVEAVVVVREEAKRVLQGSQDGPAIPDVWIPDRNRETEISPPTIPEPVGIVSSPANRLIGRVNIGGDFKEVLKGSRDVLAHLPVDIFDAECDFVGAVSSPESKAQITTRTARGRASRSGRAAPRPDNSSHPTYLAFGYVPTPGTFYRNVRALPRASCLFWEEGLKPRFRAYWEVDFDPRPVPMSRGKREVRRLVRQSIERRLVADVPVGVLLSGGLDSTIIAAVMSSLTQGRLQTFTASFEDSPTYNEAAFARLVSQRLGTVHHEVPVGPDCIEQLDMLVEAHDGPFGDSSALPVYAVTRIAKENVTVALSGEGSDELFCGYLRFRAMEMASMVPGWAAAAGRRILSSFPHDPHHRDSKRRMLRFFEAAGLPEEERWLQWVGFFVADLGRVMKPEAGPPSDLTASIRKATNGRSNVLARSLSANFGTYLVDDLLVKADRMSMANGIELRVPFLDTDLVEYAAGLPRRLLRRRGTLKYVLREAFSDVVPPAVLDRGKQGFAVPLPGWFRGPWRGVLHERVLTADARLWQWLDRDYVTDRAEAHLEGKIDYSQQLWALLTLETWLHGAGR